MSAARDQLAIQVSAEYGTQLTKNIPIAINMFQRKCLKGNILEHWIKYKLKTIIPNAQGHIQYSNVVDINAMNGADVIPLFYLFYIETCYLNVPKHFVLVNAPPGHSLINPPK